MIALRPGRIFWRRLTAVAAAVVPSMLCLTPLGAQDLLLPSRQVMLGPSFARWSFGNGLLQPTADGAGSVEIKSVSVWSVPVGASIEVGDRWRFDLSTAYSNGSVQLRGPDPVTGSDTYSLSGFSDVRVRLTSRLVGDAVVATIGANLPSGLKSLDNEEFAALRVLAAPALALPMPALGSGLGATAGLVVARQFAGWAWALGASYELRRTYTPLALATPAPGGDLDPGGAVHLSLGGDGLVGRSGMTVAVTADLFGDDRLTPIIPSGLGGDPGAATSVVTHLGPIFTADWQFRVAAPRLRELTIYAIDRYRSPYERSGVRVDQSSGNYADAGVRAVFPWSPATGVLGIVNVRHQTGLKSDSTIATAATAAAGATLGLVQSLGSGYALQPFIRAEFGTIKNANASVGSSSLAAGIALSRRF
jgi:hypothetical protein